MRQYQVAVEVGDRAERIDGQFIFSLEYKKINWS